MFWQIKRMCEECGHDEATYFTRQVYDNQHDFPFSHNILWHLWSMLFTFITLKCTGKISWWRANYILYMHQMPTSVHRQLKYKTAFNSPIFLLNYGVTLSNSLNGNVSGFNFYIQIFLLQKSPCLGPVLAIL